MALHLPKKFMPRNAVIDFIHGYNSLLNRRALMCSKCNTQINRQHDRWDQWMEHWIQLFGVQTSTCCQCSRHFCAESECKPRHCINCERHYCEDCFGMIESKRCEGGDEDLKHMICSACGDLTECQGCGRSLCDWYLGTCIGCNKRICHSGCAHWVCGEIKCKSSSAGYNNCVCENCYENEDHHLMDECSECRSIECPDCRLSNCESDWDYACVGCMKMIAPVIGCKYGSLQKENEELRQENEKLRMGR